MSDSNCACYVTEFYVFFAVIWIDLFSIILHDVALARIQKSIIGSFAPPSLVWVSKTPLSLYLFDTKLQFIISNNNNNNNNDNY